MISVVVPVFNEEKTIDKLHKSILEVLKRQNKPFEIIFVDDGSQDKTAEIAAKLKPLKLVRLQRNYGQTAAVDTGIYYSKGETILLMDADLQNDPEDIPQFLKKMDEGYDVVLGWRKNRYDHWTRVWFSKFANSIVRRLLKLDVHDFGCGLKAYRSRFVKDFRLWGEAQVFLPAVAKERGAVIGEVVVSHHPRNIGQSKIKFSNMFRANFDLIGIVFFVKYFSQPLKFFGGWGLISLAISSVIFLSAIILRLTNTLNFTATPLPTIGSLFAILGVILVMMGFLAEMLLRIHYTATGSSPYAIREIKENA